MCCTTAPDRPTASFCRSSKGELGAKAAGRELDRSSFYTTALTTIVVLDEGEAVDSPRVKAECGAMAMAAVHYAYDQCRNFGHQPPNVYREIWDDYCALLESYPEDRRHQRIHAGHNCWALPLNSARAARGSRRR